MDIPRKPSSSTPPPENLEVNYWRIDEWFPDLNPTVRAGLKKYQEELIRFNKTVNLVSPKTLPLADALHFADSILASQLIGKSEKISDIYDFGSGNGFPGLVYALLHPATRVHLIEVDGRKSEFMKHVASVLQLKNAEVHIRAVESLPEHSVAFAMSRGFAPISKAILLSRKVFKKGGSYFHLKSEEWATEVGQIPTQLCSYWSPELLGHYRLPIGEVNFAVVKTVKIAD